jgi:hypothetical protein
MKAAFVYYSGPDRYGNYHFAILWLRTGSARTSGTVLSGQHYKTDPLWHIEKFRKTHEAKDFRNDKEAIKWLTEGVVLTPTCKHCGMGEDLHVAPHEFVPETP